jgi:cyclic pyranopterin phosphate synthase
MTTARVPSSTKAVLHALSDFLHELPVLNGSAPGSPPGGDGACVKEVPQRTGLDYDPARSEADALTDGFGRRHTYLRIALVERCNLRCRYCMPAGGLDWTPDERLLTDDEILRLARLFAEGGVTKIRLTGGEPLLRPQVAELAERIGKVKGVETLAMTTNGLLLPKKLDRLHEAGVGKLNISLDTLREERFEEMTRRCGFPLVLRAIDAAIERGYRPKVNCVVMRGVNDDEVPDFVRFTKERPVEVRFIEYMPFGGNGWQDDRLVPFRELLGRVEDAFPSLESRADGPHETARTYRVPGFAGRVGFIASMTAPFCEGCNRLRLTADGHLKVCLFGQKEVSLRDPMRTGATDDELRRIVSRAVGGKQARHAGMYTIAERKNRPMIAIGG